MAENLWGLMSGSGVEEGEPFSPQGKLLPKTVSVPIVLS